MFVVEVYRDHLDLHVLTHSFPTRRSSDLPFHWIASEGGLLERPVELRSLSLAPGERAEILVDFADGRSIAPETGMDTNAPMMMGRSEEHTSELQSLMRISYAVSYSKKQRQHTH